MNKRVNERVVKFSRTINSFWRYSSMRDWKIVLWLHWHVENRKKHFKTLFFKDFVQLLNKDEQTNPGEQVSP